MFDWEVGCCSRCQSKALSRKLKAEPIGYSLCDRVDMSAKSLPYGLKSYGFKSVYPVKRDSDGEIVGFITIEDGWGKKWAIYGWSSNLRMGDLSEGKMPDPIMACDYDSLLKVKKKLYKADPNAPDEYDNYESTLNKLSSKEAALLLFPDLDAQGELKTESEVRASDAETAADWKRRADERAAQIAEDARRREDARVVAQQKREALLTDIRDVLFNSEPPLANFARDVLIRTALAAGYTQAELDDSFNIDKLDFETHSTAPLAAGEAETDEWGEVIVRG